MILWYIYIPLFFCTTKKTVRPLVCKPGGSPGMVNSGERCSLKWQIYIWLSNAAYPTAKDLSFQILNLIRRAQHVVFFWGEEESWSWMPQKTTWLTVLWQVVDWATQVSSNMVWQLWLLKHEHQLGQTMWHVFLMVIPLPIKTPNYKTLLEEMPPPQNKQPSAARKIKQRDTSWNKKIQENCSLTHPT